MARKSLDEIRDELQDAFETAVGYGKAYKGNTIGPEHLKAAAQLAQAIVAVEDKIDQRNVDKNGMKMPGKTG